MRKIIILLISFLIVFADDFKNSKEIIQKTNNSLQNIQENIDILDKKRDDIVDEYLNLTIKLENLKNQNEQLGKRVNLQKEKLSKMQSDINNIDKTKNSILPLMTNMILALEKLILQDTPFLLNERKNRLENLKKIMQKPDISTSEKFRKILEAYEIEYDYSNNINTYQENLQDTAYTFLKLGRVGFYRQSLDKSNYDIWDIKSNQWRKINSIHAKVNIAKAIKIAKKQISPELLTMPFVNIKDIR